MELYFATLAFGAHVTALILATAGIVAFTYKLRSRRMLALATAVSYVAHLGFLTLS